MGLLGSTAGSFVVEIIFDGKDDVSGPAGKAANAIANLGRAVIQGGALIASGLVAVGGAMAKLALDAVPFDGIRQSFEGLASGIEGGSRTMLDALRKASGGMISTRDLMLSFNKAAQLVSLDFAKRLPEAMGALAKVAASTGQDLDYLLDSLVTGVGRLSPMILDNMGLTIDMTAVYEKYAEALGISVDEMTKAQKQAAIMDEVLRQLNENTKNMPDALLTAGASVAMFQATLQNARDELGSALLPALRMFMAVLMQIINLGLPPLLELIGRIAPYFEKAARVIMDFVTGNITWSRALKDIFFPVLRDFFGTESAITQGFLALIGFVARLANALQGKVFEDAPPIFVKLRDFRNDIADLWGRFWQLVSAVSSSRDSLIALAVAVGSVVLPLIGTLLTRLAPLGLTFLALRVSIGLLRTAWETNFGGIQEITAAAFSGLGGVIEGVKTTLLGLGEAVIANLPKAFEMIQGVLAGVLLPAFQGAANFITTTVIPAIGTLVEWLSDMLPTAIDVAAGIWQDLFQPALEAVANFIMSDALPIIKNLIGGVVGFFAKMRETGVLAKFGEILNRVVKFAVDFIKALGRKESVDSFLDIMLRLVDAIADFTLKVLDFLTPLLEWITANVDLNAILAILAGLLASQVVGAVISFVGALMPVISTIGGVVSAIVGFISGLGGLVAAAGPVLAAIASIIAALAPFLLIIGAIIAVVLALKIAWENDFLGMRTAITEFWENSVKPAFAALKEWLAVFIPAAIQVVSDFWTNTLKPAMLAVWEFIQNMLLPIFKVVVDFMRAVVGVAIAALAAVWRGVLLPAIQMIYNFFQTAIIPVFNAVARLMSAVVGAAIRVLAALWENTLKPAIEVVIDIIAGVLESVFTNIINTMKMVLGPAIEAATWLFDKLSEGIDWLINLASKLVYWLNKIIAALNKVAVPEDLLPGSPPPFALGLMAVNQQLEALAKARIPELQMAFSALDTSLKTPELGAFVQARETIVAGTTVTNNYTLNVAARQMREEDVVAGFDVLKVLTPGG